MVDELIFHNDCIQKFNAELYDNIFSEENIVSKHRAITVLGDKHYGYYLEKDRTSYFMPTAHLDKLPFKVVKVAEHDYKGEVFQYITEVKSIKIPAEKRMSFRALVDDTPAFQHTKRTHFSLYKIVAFAAYIDRINVRISTDAGFGKDSVAGIIQQLVDSTVNIYGATFAKLEYSLINKLMILNEMGNLKPDEKVSMQEFLLATGAYFNTYTKRTRKTATTQEQYDISKLSLMIFYNLPEYYRGKAQEFFDQMFTKAVIHRFIPFYFEGRLTTKFENIIDVNKLVNENSDVYKNVIATLNYFRQNKLNAIDYEIPKEVVFSEQLSRYRRTFNVILKYVSAYSRTQEEFNVLAMELFNCYKKYETLLITEKTLS